MTIVLKVQSQSLIISGWCSPKHVQSQVKPVLKFRIFKSKSLFMSCELNTLVLLSSYAFLQQSKNHDQVDNAIYFSLFNTYSTVYNM